MPEGRFPMLLMPIVLAYCINQTKCVCLDASNCSDPGSPKLHWESFPIPHIDYSVGSPITDGTEVTAIDTAFNTWNSAAAVQYQSSGIDNSLSYLNVYKNQTPGMGNETTDNNSTVGFYPSGAGWPYPTGTIAITFNWFTASGTIGECDMLLNAQDYTWTDVDPPATVHTDIQAIVTHESGHWMGLGHSSVAGATMVPVYNQGEVSIRTLAQDDITAAQICYGPPGSPSNACVSSTKPGLFGTSCGCDLSGESRPLAGSVLLIAFAGLALFFRRRPRLGASLCGLGAMAFAGTARATVTIDLPLDQLTAASDAVVLGTVEKVAVVTDGSTIHTNVHLVVSGLLAGRDPGGEVLVKEPGGTLPDGVTAGGYAGLLVDGAPGFRAADEVVVFLQRLPDGAFTVVGMKQGKLTVVRDGADGTARLYRDEDTALKLERLPTGELIPALGGIDPLSGITLDSLAAKLALLPTHRP